jgi:CHRD domain-containing protein
VRRSLILVALAALLLVAVVVPGAGAANGTDYRAPLSAAQEFGVVDAPGAGGSAVFWVDGNTLHYEVTVRHLTGAAIQAHIHGPADRHVNAGVSIWLCGTAAAPGPTGTPVCSSTTDGVLVAGSATVTTDQLAMLDAMLGYANVHTALHPAGEVRGQVLPVGPDK